MMRNTAETLLLLDAEGIVTFAGPRGTRERGPAGLIAPGAALPGLVAEPERPGVVELLAALRTVPGSFAQRDLALFSPAIGGSEAPVWYEVAFTNCLDDPSVGGIVVNMHPVTARKKAEQAASQALEEAVRARRAEARFLAHMSHELRTPLNAIIGFGEVMGAEIMGPLGSDRYRDYADNICRAGNHLLAVINAVLDFSRAEAGQLDLDEARVDVDRLVDDCRMLVDQQAQMKSLLFEVEPVAQVALHGDARLLRQAVLNLINNAVKYTPVGGKVTVRFRVALDGSPLIEVEDTGVGMHADEVAIALRPFGRIRNEFTRDIEGTGLGLAITKHIAERHGGNLIIDSVRGRGTIVQIMLPPMRLVVAEVD
jgi:signal transduction histidine kinase